jgi:hypothetical protein
MPRTFEAVRAEALFASGLQASQEPAADQVRLAVASTLRRSATSRAPRRQHPLPGTYPVPVIGPFSLLRLVGSVRRRCTDQVLIDKRTTRPCRTGRLRMGSRRASSTSEPRTTPADHGERGALARDGAGQMADADTRRTFRNSRIHAGWSGQARPDTMVPSMWASLSTQVAPAAATSGAHAG